MLRRTLARRELSSLAGFSAEGAHRFVRQYHLSSPLVRLGLFGTLLLGVLVPGPVLHKGAIGALIRLLRSALELHREVTDSPESDVSTADDRLKWRPSSIGGSASFDEIVVGSGPGGAVAALVATLSGRRVLVIEEGRAPSNCSSHSVNQLLLDFRFAGQQVILGAPVVPFAEGAVLGGGSEVNSGLYHRVPPHVLEHWLSATGATIEEWQSAVDDVEQRLPINIQPNSSLGVYANSPIPRIAEVLEWQSSVIPRWRTYDGKNYRHHGMLDTYLKSAEEAGAVIIGDARVARIEMERSGSSVKVITQDATFRSENVVVAGGTLGTPDILARSGLFPLRRSSFGFHLMSKVAVRFPFAINDFTDIDPHQAWRSGGSAKLGVSASTPEILQSTFAGLGVETRRVDEQCGVYYVSIPASGRGGLVRAGGSVQPWFRMDERTRREIEAKTVDLEAAVEAVGGEVLARSRRVYSTVHIFGSLPIGTTAAVDEHGVVRGTKGRIRVSDASLLPLAPAVNPQGPLMHLATLLARRAP